MAKYGIDVSDNQGVIDWKKVKEAGVKFAILRTVRRSSKIDKQLENNIKGCIANGIPADFYKYGYALTEAESEREAKEVVLALETLGIKSAKDVVIWHDVEDDTQTALSTAQLTKICQAFKKVVEYAGYTYGLYMGKYDFEKGEVKLYDLGETHVWLARYYDGYVLKPFGQEPNEKYKPTVPGGELWGWQYTSSGRVKGIVGNVDLNVAYYEISGLRQEAPDEIEDTDRKTRSRYVAQARAWLGKNEKDCSHRDIIDVYNSHSPLARGYKVKYSDSWCATFVSAVAIVVDYTDIIPTECSCQQMIERFKEIGCWMEDDAHVPLLGDIVFYDWQDSGTGDNAGWTDHVGIVESVSVNYITVIEGNYNDGVGRRVIQINGKYIRGYGVPRFDDEGISKMETTMKKSIDEIAQDVIDGKYGNGEIRKKKLEAEGYDYETVRARVNQIIEEQKYYPKYNGNSNRVDEVLAAIGVPEMYVGNKTKRKPVGKANGFPDYTGKQNENLAIISLAKQGKLKKP